YNASTFTGISFKAKSPSSDTIVVQMVDPSADPDQGWNFRSSPIKLSAEWDTYEVPFSSVLMPAWVADLGGPSGSVDPSGLIAIAFVIRNVTAESGTNPDTMMAVEGESLGTYEIHLDDVSFY